MSTAEITEKDLYAVRDRAALFAFLNEKLDWPVDPEDTFTYPGPPLPDEIQSEISQIVPFATGDPFTIMLVEFAAPFRRTDLREILRLIRQDIRTKAKYEGRKLDEIIFVCAEENYIGIRFAHFEEQIGGQTKLSVFGWDKRQPGSVRTLIEWNLKALRYPENPEDAAAWFQKWVSAFDVQAATNLFYKEYERVFKQVEVLIRLPLNPNLTAREKEEKKRLFTQCLLNRLMFIHFVSKKNWLKFNGRTDYLAALWAQRDPTQNFYSTHLIPLFFAGLNNPQAYNLNSATLAKQIGEVPYLNGGLFDKGECDETGEQIDDAAFGLIIEDLFLPFNFTVMESTPLDVEVAVDPEMLGKVFEKLMTGPLREGKGAYYTSRSIVTFMCREAIKSYLAQAPADAPNATIPMERIARLVDSGDDQAVSLAEAKRLLARLTKLRVVDPACGSGAYLLGMMQELFALTRLLDTRAENEQSRDDYQRKLGLIQNNLYGVDIDPFAVNIAMLRLWLSLIVDYREADPGKLLPLPNLDFKIELGDSLLAPDPQGISDLFRRELIERADDLKRLKARYFSVTGAEKADLRRDILAQQAALIAALHADLPPEAFEWRVQFAEVFKPEIAGATVGGAMNFGQELAEADVPGGFHIVIANPPYGVKVGDAVRQAYFPDASQSKDTYGLFMARALQLLCDGGEFCYIVSDTWRTIKSHLPLRKMLLESAAVHHVIDLPTWVFDATVNTGIVTLTKGRAAPNHTLIAGDLRSLERGDWNALETNLRIIAARGVDVQTQTYARYTYPQNQIADYENRSFFIGSPKLYTLLNNPNFISLSSVAVAKDGMTTGDNEYYIRKREGVRGSYTLLDEAELLTEAEIAALSDAEKKDGIDPAQHDGRHFVPYDKGGESDTEDGWLPNYYVPTGYFIDWSQESVHRLKTATRADIKKIHGDNPITIADKKSVASYMRNTSYYFRTGITFSRTGIYAPTFRLTSQGAFDSKSNGLFPRDNTLFYLGLMNALLSKFIIKSFLCHTVQAESASIAEMIIPGLIAPETIAQIGELVAAIIEKQKAELRYAYHLHEQREIDALVYELYGLDENDIREVELWFCRRYPALAKAQGVWKEAETRYADYLERAALLLAKPPDYWHSHPVYERIAAGEGPALEFKRALCTDIQGAESRDSVSSVLREIAGFLNASGGTLLIGVADNGAISGIAPDLRFVNRDNQDGFELKLRQLMETRLSPNPHGLAQIGFETLPEGVVCVVEVAPAPGVTYFEEKVYLRDGNRTVPLEGRRLVEWLQRRK